MHHRSLQNAWNRHRSQTTDRPHLNTRLDRGRAVPSSRFRSRSLVPALCGLSLFGTLAAYASSPAVARATSATTVATPTTVARSSGVIDEFAVVDGTRMHIRCVGSGAPTVVLIAGFNDGGDNWGSIEAPIAQGARVCSSARFGTGTSDAPPAVQTFTSQATQLRTALESVGEPGPYVVVGHSYGGAEAVAFASMFASDVSGLLRRRRCRQWRGDVA